MADAQLDGTDTDNLPGIEPASARSAHVAFGVFGALIGVVVLVVGLIVGLGIWWSLLLAVLVGVGVAVMAYLRMDDVIIAKLGAVELAPGSQPRLENLVDGLCVANGFRSPKLMLIDDVAPNMAMVGRDPEHASLLVTSGLLDRLDRVELEAAVAHQLLRMRTRQTLMGGTVGVLIARPLGFAPGLASSLADRLLDSRALPELDLASVRLTRFPPGLSRALQSLRNDGREPTVNPEAFRHLWLNPPPGGVARQDFSLDERIDVLELL